MEVRIGPKSYRSRLPVGFVTGSVIDNIEAAEIGQLGKAFYNFNIRVSKEELGEAYYEAALVLNGHSNFKRYGLLDVVLYKLGRLVK